jgi:hypothetical protein
MCGQSASPTEITGEAPLSLVAAATGVIANNPAALADSIALVRPLSIAAATAIPCFFA